MTAKVSTIQANQMNLTNLATDTNPLENGLPNVWDDNLELRIVPFGNTKIVLKDDEILNPFFVGLNEIQLKDIDDKELYSVYKRVLIMCMRITYNKEVEAEKIYNPILTKQELKSMGKYLTLVSCSRKILNSDAQYSRVVRVKKQFLTHFNNGDLHIENEELILPMFELKEDMTKLHVGLYESSNTVAQISNAVSLNSYYNSDYPQRTQKQLSQLIMSIKESNYWTNPHNCKISMTDQWSARSFQYREIKDANMKLAMNEPKEKELNSVISELAKSNNNKDKEGYQISSQVGPRQDNFVDLSKVLKTQNKRTYYATVDNGDMVITKDQVTELFKTLKNEKDIFDVFNTLLVSKEYCHLVLNNYDILVKMEPIINKFLPLYKYLIGYAWVAFYIEECLFKTKTTKDSRYVFDIRTANKLPIFPYAQDDIYQNPYITFLVNEKAADVQNNCMATGMYEDITGSRIDTLERFIWKFNLFTSGDPSKNIFDGLEWGNKYAVSGSMIPAFVSVKPPLFDTIVNKGASEVDQWLQYFNHQNPDSDIDFMCNVESVFDFIDSINTVKQVVENNLSTKVMGGQKVVVEVEPIKTTSVIVTATYLREKIDEIREKTGNEKLTIEDILSSIKFDGTLESNEIKEYFHNLYHENKMKTNRVHRQTYKNKINSMYENYFKPVSIDDIKVYIVDYELSKDDIVERDCETCTYYNDILDASKQVSTDKNIMVFKIAENIKFKLRSDKMLHCIEAFRAKSRDFFAVVGRFHLPCVRGYYNGATVYLEPSCITANMTGINIEYKYFAGVRDPIDILNKYRLRGFGTIMNSAEKQHMLFYNANIAMNCKMFKLDPKTKDKENKENMKALFGFKDVNEDVYKTGHFINGLPLDTYNKQNKQQLKTINDLKRYYATKHGYDIEKTGLNMFRFRTINSEGEINPLEKWIIDACWDLMNKNQN